MIEIVLKDYKVIFVIVHVLSVVVAMGAAFSSDFLFNFYVKDRVISPHEKKSLSLLSLLVRYGLCVVILSGLLLFLTNTTYYLASSKFISKMVIMVVLIMNGFILEYYVWRHINTNMFKSSDSKYRQVAFVCGAISVSSWVSVLILGSLDAISINVIQILSVYCLVTATAIMLAITLSHSFYKKK